MWALLRTTIQAILSTLVALERNTVSSRSLITPKWAACGTSTCALDRTLPPPGDGGESKSNWTWYHPDVPSSGFGSRRRISKKPSTSAVVSTCKPSKEALTRAPATSSLAKRRAMLTMFFHTVSSRPGRLMPASSSTRPFRNSSLVVPYPRYGRISNGSSSPKRRFSLNLKASKRSSMACPTTSTVRLKSIN